MENYKEKYEQALERCKKEFNFNNLAYSHEEIKQRLENVFPELKESDDEQIKNEIIDYLKGFIPHHNDDLVAKSKLWITWLEKQGEESVVTNVLIKAGLKPYKDGNKWCILLGDNIQEGICGFGDTVDDALFEFLKELIEKQDEQKPIEKVKPKFKVGDTIVEKDLDECGYETIKDIKNGQYIFTDGYCMNIDEQEGWQLVKTPTIIEQKPAWSEEDEKHYQGCLNLMKLSLDTKPYPYYNDYLWLKSLKDRIQPQPKQEWSEEDWKYYHKLEMFLEVNEHYSKTEKSSGYQKDVHETLSWLKSLRPNKYVTWSEEDEVMVEDIIEAIDTQYAVSDYNEMVDWLKSLKERYTWKPSDEQIEALLKLEEMHVLEHEKNQENAHLYMVIKNIREQLQKLRKE